MPNVGTLMHAQLTKSQFIDFPLKFLVAKDFSSSRIVYIKKI